MASQFRKPFDLKLPKNRHETEEFAAQKGLLLCSDCGAVYFKKHWHHGLEKLNNPEMAAVVKSADKKAKAPSVKFVLCPACQMIKNGQYEGRVVIKNVPRHQAGKLEELIEGFCRRAYDIDPMDRLIAIKKSSGSWEARVTENQLANKLGKKIQNAFSGVKTKTHFAAEPSDVAEVAVEFPK